MIRITHRISGHMHRLSIDLSFDIKEAVNYGAFVLVLAMVTTSVLRMDQSCRMVWLHTFCSFPPQAMPSSSSLCLCQCYWEEA